MRVFSWLVPVQEHAQRTPVSPPTPLQKKRRKEKERKGELLQLFISEKDPFL